MRRWSEGGGRSEGAVRVIANVNCANGGRGPCGRWSRAAASGAPRSPLPQRHRHRRRPRTATVGPTTARGLIGDRSEAGQTCGVTRAPLPGPALY
jgi:hypothetical protein